MDYLGQVLAAEKAENRLRFYRAMDFQKVGDKNSILLNLLGSSGTTEEKAVIFRLLDLKDLKAYPKLS